MTGLARHFKESVLESYIAQCSVIHTVFSAV